MRGKRTRLEEGIYQDAYGLSATVKVAGVQREGRWPLDTDREILRRWRIQKRAELDTDRETRPKLPRGLLQVDGEQWIQRKAGMACFKSDRCHLRAWYPVLGKRSRTVIDREMVATVIASWRGAGVAPRTIRHRVRLLRECYQGIDGPKAKTPVDDIALGEMPRPEPTAVPVAVIRAVAKRLKTAAASSPSVAKHYARFLVRATTGQRPVQIGRAVPADVNLRQKIWYVRTSKGGHPIPLPLNAGMLAAWRAFAKADAWGPFDTSTAAKVLHDHGWPKGTRPYDLRHTFAIDLLLSGADLGDVQGVLGHSQIQTTRSHYAPILTARLRSVTAKRRLTLA